MSSPTIAISSSPFRNKSTQQRCQHILVTFQPNLQSLIINIYENVNKEYAFVHLLKNESQKIHANKELKKRITKGILVKKLESLIQLDLTNYQSWIWVHYTKNPQQQLQFKQMGSKCKQFNIKCQLFFIKQQINHLQLEAIITKYLHLDFIWIGVSGRIGCSIPSFMEKITQYNNFKQDDSNENVNYIKQFLNAFDQQLLKNSDSIKDEKQAKYAQKLIQIFHQCQSQLEEFAGMIENEIIKLICERFNERIIVSELTYHHYYKILKTRNYFKSIWIEEACLKRYNNFKKQILNNELLHNVTKWIDSSITNFLLLDDYLYEKFLQRVSFQADFVINTGIGEKDFSDIIQTNSKEIFRSFRPDFDEYFISLCLILKNRGGCIKQAVGSIIVKNKRILSTGYNGTPMGSVNCYNGGCLVCNNSNELNTLVLSCNCIHAQYSCIIEAGIEMTPGSILYTTQLPCLWCAKVIVQARISEVVYIKTDNVLLEYGDQIKVFEIFKKAKIESRQFNWREKKFSKI